MRIDVRELVVDPVTGRRPTYKVWLDGKDVSQRCDMADSDKGEVQIVKLIPNKGVTRHMEYGEVVIERIG